jgi:F-type H+-transporting ATPase subunit a
VLTALGLAGASTSAFAEGGLPHVIDYYDMILHALHLEPKWAPTVGALFALAVITVIGLIYKSAVAAAGTEVTPTGKFSLRFVVEMLLDLVHSIAKDNGGHNYRKFFPFLAGLFLFILTCNLSGLIPGFPPATEKMDTNVAMGLFVFVVYNLAGVKEHGGGYIKHFFGPVWWIAPLFFAIELVSHGSRPLSLGLRLMGNIYGDHTLLAVFTKLTWIGFPAALMFFGLLVAVVQSFVFTLLTGIYISLAISHEH